MPSSPSLGRDYPPNVGQAGEITTDDLLEVIFSKFCLPAEGGYWKITCPPSISLITVNKIAECGFKYESGMRAQR
jgi:hypothetical protein